MPFVKLDTGILDSTLWVERECREVFLTALLMAEPIELMAPMQQIEIRTMKETGFAVPVGWYGMIHAAGLGIIRRSMVEQEVGLIALERLGAPDLQSRSPDFEGRRLVRVDGGFIVLNFMKYRDRDYTGAERAKRYRERQKNKGTSHRDVTASHRDITQAEAEAYKIKPTVRTRRSNGSVYRLDWFEDFWSHYPKKTAKQDALKAWGSISPDSATMTAIIPAIERAKLTEQWRKDNGQFIPLPATWLRGRRWMDEPPEEPPPQPRQFVI